MPTVININAHKALPKTLFPGRNIINREKKHS